MRLEAEIAQNIEAQSSSWGLHVEAIKLEDIAVPEELKKMMSRQASTRAREARDHHQGRRRSQAATALAEAASTMAASPGAMQLRTLQTIDGLGPSASNTVVLGHAARDDEALRVHREQGGLIHVATVCAEEGVGADRRTAHTPSATSTAPPPRMAAKFRASVTLLVAASRMRCSSADRLRLDEQIFTASKVVCAIIPVTHRLQANHTSQPSTTPISARIRSP